MYVSHRQELLFEVLRDGRLFRSFSTRGNALAYIAAARELVPNSDWSLRLCDVVEEDEDYG